MTSGISYAELDQLAGEVLPERAALSVVNLGFNDGGGSSSPPPPDPSGYVVSDGNGSSVYYACQTTQQAGSQGLIGAVGLNPPSTTTTCMPAAIASH